MSDWLGPVVDSNLKRFECEGVEGGGRSHHITLSAEQTAFSFFFLFFLYFKISLFIHHFGGILDTFTHTIPVFLS